MTSDLFQVAFFLIASFMLIWLLKYDSPIETLDEQGITVVFPLKTRRFAWDDLKMVVLKWDRLVLCYAEGSATQKKLFFFKHYYDITAYKTTLDTIRQHRPDLFEPKPTAKGAL